MTGLQRSTWSLVAVAVCGARRRVQPSPIPDRVQGYVEGEFVYVASPLRGHAGNARRAARRAGEGR